MSIRRCEIEQQVKYLPEEQITKGIKDRRAIKYVAYICHDKDTYTKEDEEKNPEHKAGTMKEPHWHIILVFYEGQQQQLKYVAAWFGQQPERVQKIKSRRVEDAFLYLIHQNAPDKYQYDPSEVKANFDYITFIKENAMFLDRGDEIVSGIDNGIITRENYTQYVNIHEYVQYSKQMEKAFSYAEKKVNSVNRELDAIFICGASGTGKTSLAKYMAEQKGYSCFVSSIGQDMLDGYEDEDVIVFNDIRGNCGLALNEFIQITDNNTNARGKSRFRNKSLNKCKMIIVTTIYSMDQLLRELDPKHDEDWVQFYRRFKLYIVTYPDHIEVSQYSAATKSYGDLIKLDNPIKDLIQETLLAAPMTPDELSDYLHIPLLIDTLPSDEEPYEEIKTEKPPTDVSIEKNIDNSDVPPPDIVEGLSDVTLPF